MVFVDRSPRNISIAGITFNVFGFREISDSGDSGNNGMLIVRFIIDRFGKLEII